MGSKVEPYFILTAEKVTNPKELDKIESDKQGEKTPPTTPAPSGVSGNTLKVEITSRKFKKKKRHVVKYKIPVKEVRLKDSMNKRMEMIKETLERSRERFNEQKLKQGDVDLKCEPLGLGYDEHGMPLFKLDRSVSDMGTPTMGSPDKKKTDPFVYFVVSEERLRDPSEIIDGDKVKSRSADRRRRVRIVEENRLKRKEKQTPSAKMRTLAREIGLKSNPVAKSSDGGSSSGKTASMNMIVFPGPDYDSSVNTRPHTHGHSRSTRVMHSPTRNPPDTPANTVHSDFRIDQTAASFIDVDDTVPRKPFLSSPMYNGKIKGLHALSMNHFELPIISPDQKRRNLGLGMSTRFNEFAYPSSKPQSEQRQRKVSFADPLPVIRGSGFVLSTGENKDSAGSEIPSLGPRAATLGSITLPSEQADKQIICHKYLAAGENTPGSRSSRRYGVPLPLPKIDIVSNVYDEMIIKMIQEYLQDSNTPSRQSQLAKELLSHLQKHNEHMKQINVPNLDRGKSKPHKSELSKHQKKAQKLLNDINFSVPPNTAEESEIKLMTPLRKDRPCSEIPESVGESGEENKQDMQKSIPFVQITFKARKDQDTPVTPLTTEADRPETDDTGALLEEKQMSPTSSSGKRSARDRPILSAVTPVSFQMVPPGLSKDDSFVAVSLKA